MSQPSIPTPALNRLEAHLGALPGLIRDLQEEEDAALNLTDAARDRDRAAALKWPGAVWPVQPTGPDEGAALGLLLADATALSARLSDTLLAYRAKTALMEQNGKDWQTELARLEAASKHVVRLDEDFVRDDLPDDDRKRYDLAWEYLDDMRNGPIAEYLKGGSGESPEGRACVYPYRQVRSHSHALTAMNLETRDPRTVDAMCDLFETFLKLPEKGHAVGASKQYALVEQPPGMKDVLRLNWYSDKDGDGSIFSSTATGTPVYPLDFCLHEAGVAEGTYFLWCVKDEHPRAAALHPRMAAYHAGLVALRRNYSRVFYKGKPSYTWAKALRHPTQGLYASAFLSDLMGVPGFEEEVAFFGAALMENQSVVNGLFSARHGVAKLYVLQGAPASQNAFIQDMTYPNEEWPSAELLCRLGSPVYTPEVMTAIARTLDERVFDQGYGADTVNRSIDGSHTKREPVRQVQRNLSTLPLVRIYSERIDADLNTLDENAEMGRHAVRIVRFLGGRRL